MSARAAKRELAEALRGYPWERWSTRSVVWAAGMLARDEERNEVPMSRSLRLEQLARALGLDPRLISAGLGIGAELMRRLESAAYLWEHAGEEPMQADADLTIEDDYEDLSTS